MLSANSRRLWIACFRMSSASWFGVQLGPTLKIGLVNDFDMIVRDLDIGGGGIVAFPENLAAQDVPPRSQRCSADRTEP